MGHPAQSRGRRRRARGTAVARGSLQPLYPHGRGIPLLAVFDRPARARRASHHAHPTVPALSATASALGSRRGRSRLTEIGKHARANRLIPTWPARHRLATQTKFASLCCSLVCELRNRRTLATY